MREYEHKLVEKKWQKEWSESSIYTVEDDSQKPKSYVLDMFPYPSGEGLHIGHPKGYIATDIYSRYKHMTGHNVLHPMGCLPVVRGAAIRQRGDAVDDSLLTAKRIVFQKLNDDSSGCAIRGMQGGRRGTGAGVSLLEHACDATIRRASRRA